MPQLDLYFLGSPRIEKDGVAVDVSRRKVIPLLAYLGVMGGNPSRDTLATLLWPNNDHAEARAELRRILSLLRKVLGERWLEVDRKKVGLKRDDGLSLDVDGFRGHLLQCRSHGHPSTEVCGECVKPLTEAVNLYKGDFLEGFTLNDSVNFDDWQFSETQNLRTEMTGALEHLMDWYRSQEEFDAAIDYARRCLEIDRADEAAHRQLIEMYAKTGRRTASLRQYEECVRVLAEELSTSPQDETLQLYEAIKENRVAVPSLPSYKSSDIPTNNLPRQLTSFIGRKGEMEKVKRLLSNTYLLTLTGVGGCGKTRLALEVASQLAEECKDGVWLVELAPLSDPDLVPQEVASALDLSEGPDRSFMDTLSDYLKSKEILLLLDNCEHLIDACSMLSYTLLSACPNLKILATSREGLGIGGETTWSVPSLSTPHPDRIQSLVTSDLRDYEAINLFVDRAQAAFPTFTLTEANAPAVAGICHRLDGIPLTIELAAARVKSLSVEEIKVRLDDDFRLLTGGSRSALPRQQTLQATIDWSYNLLSDFEKTLLSRLSVFSGGWILPAAEKVCIGERNVGSASNIHPVMVLDLLTSLVDKSLVMAEGDTSAETGGEKTRYRMLETVRGYSRDRLMQSGDAERVRDLHLDYFLRFAEEAEPVIQRGSDRRVWGRLEAEHDNLRGALDWSRGSGKTEKGLRLAGAIYQFWLVKGYQRESREWLEGMLSEEGKTSASVRAKALRLAGRLIAMQGDIDLAIKMGDESVSLYREVGDNSGLAIALGNLSGTLGMQGDNERAAELIEESLIINREMDDKRGIALSLQRLGDLAHEYEGDYDRALVFLEESLSLSRELGDRLSVAWSLTLLGDTLLRQGDLERAEVTLEESLTLSQEVVGDNRASASIIYVLGQLARSRGNYERATELYKESIELAWEGRMKNGVSIRMEALGGVAVAQNQLERGARLLGAAEAIRQEIGASLIPYDRANHDRSVAALRTQLDEKTFAAAWTEGQKMSMEEAVEYALDEQPETDV